MIRLFVFELLGPVLGLLVLTALGGGFKSHVFQAFAIVLPFALAAGLVPALITAAFDRAMNRRGERGISKYLLTGGFGYVAAYLLTIENVFEVTPLVP
jgi:hypothetical protein